jgi:hypothetical protein
MVELSVSNYHYGSRELNVSMRYASGNGDQAYARAMAAAMIDAAALMDVLYAEGVGVIDRVFEEVYGKSVQEVMGKVTK